jgi:hypothetical protein
VVKVKWILDYGSNIEYYDSLLIEPNSGETLFIITHGIEQCDGPFFQDVDATFKQIQILKYDTLPSKLDYRLNKQWSYSNGHYQATVTESEF